MPCWIFRRRSGRATFDLGPRQVHVPRDLTVEQVVPSQIRIDFNPSAARTVEVRPRVIGSFVCGYGIIDVTADPSTITITGPENRVNAIDAAITDPVDATGVVGKATFTTHAYVPDPLVRVQHPGPIHVTVTTGRSSSRSGPALSAAQQTKPQTRIIWYRWNSRCSRRVSAGSCDCLCDWTRVRSALGRPRHECARGDWAGHARIERVDQRKLWRRVWKRPGRKSSARALLPHPAWRISRGRTDAPPAS